MNRRLVPILLPALCWLAACGPGGGRGDGQEPQRPAADAAPPPAAAAPVTGPIDRPAPSLEEAARATYAGLFDGSPITLADGRWEGEPYVAGGASAPRAGLVEEFVLQGDLDGDGSAESAVLLWTSTGGSGTFDYLAVLGRTADGSVVNRATAGLGDRVRVRDAQILGGRIVLDLVQAGPGDAACCPGEKVRRTFALESASLSEKGAEPQGRLSLADLAGEWQLTHFGRDEPAGEGIGITLRFEGEGAGGRLSGSSGCNRYVGTVAPADAPGALSVDPAIAVTRMACPEPQMAAEQRFLQALANASSFSFLAGRLVLTWSDGDAGGSLRFIRPEQAAPHG